MYKFHRHLLCLLSSTLEAGDSSRKRKGWESLLVVETKLWSTLFPTPSEFPPSSFSFMQNLLILLTAWIFRQTAAWCTVCYYLFPNPFAPLHHNPHPHPLTHSILCNCLLLARSAPFCLSVCVCVCQAPSYIVDTACARRRHHFVYWTTEKI
jgi:hypothetical protein